MEPHRYTWLPLAFALTACAALTGSHRSTPLVTYHQHLVSPATAALWEEKVFDASDLIAQLDAAGIERAVVLSVAYLYGDERRQFENEYARVRAENDWTEQQVARYPERLIGFCGVSPLRDYALEELRRCSTLPHMKGLKLHLGNSGVNLRDAEHRRRVATIFAAANERRLPIVIHMRTRVAWPYGREDAVGFINDILPHAPDSIIQIAHLAGAGPGYPANADEVMEVFAEAFIARDARMRNVYFDVSSAATAETTTQEAALIANRIRQIGVERFVFGADLSIRGNPAPAESWRIFREKIPLTEKEFSTIAGNVLPFVKGELEH